jgi:hypothetical protein
VSTSVSMAMRAADRRMAAWTSRHPWQWGILYGVVMGMSVGVGDGRRDGLGQGVVVGLSVGVFTALVQGVATREKAAGRWTRSSRPGPVLRGCRLVLMLCLAVVVTTLLAASFLGPASSLAWLLTAVLITAVVVASTVLYARRV